jgi:CBS domain-containing protein
VVPRTEAAFVEDVMSRDLVTCSLSAPIAALAVKMATHRVHAVFVIDDENRPAGLVSDVDLLTGEWLGTDQINLEMLRATTAADLMSAPAQTIAAQASLERAAQRMCELKVARLLVCDGERAVGVVAVADLVAAVRRPPARRVCARDVMSHAIVTCRPEAPMHAAVRAMVERRSRSVVVTEMDRPVGVLTGGDVLALYATPRGADGSGAVAEFMTTPVVVAVPDLPLHRAVDRMLTHEIHRLVIVDGDGRGPLGILSTADVVAEMAHEQSVWQTPR